MTPAEREADAAGHPGPSLLLLLLLLLLCSALLLNDPETQDEVHRKEMPKKSRALGPPQAMMNRTIQRAAGEEKFASALCETAACTTGL